MKCFERKEYLDSFINGQCFHMSSAESFRNSDSFFQGDISECSILKDGGIHGRVFIGKGKPEIEIGEADIHTIAFDNYLYCFFALPKDFFAIENGKILYDEESPYYEDFIKCLDNYKINSETKKCYAVIVDAYSLINRINYALNKVGGVDYEYGYIEYKEISTFERIKLWANHESAKLIFIKDPAYSYQREFRYCVFMQNGNNAPFFEFSGQALGDIVFWAFEYKPKSFF